MRRYLAIFLVLAVTSLVSHQALATAVAGPTEQLRPTLAKLISLLADPALKGEENKTERRERIMASIKSGFDFKEMSKKVLGRTWREISEAEREQFTELMTKLLENVYIGKLEGYSGQTIGYVDERIKGERAQVATLLENDGLKIPIYYIMALQGEKWMVYDINIEGVSLVRNYMEQFRSILRTDKFEGLIKILEEKNRSFGAGENNG